MDAEFAGNVRELLTALAGGGEPGQHMGGGLGRVLRESGASTARASVEGLTDRWFRAVPSDLVDEGGEPVLNRPDLGDSEKIYVTLREHVVRQRRWQELSSNESTFYRYRRAAIAAFGERLWVDIVERPIPTNRPAPEYVRCIGRAREVQTLLRWLCEPGGTIVGVEGPGGSGKTALLHGVADACLDAARTWRPVTATPVFDALVWTACSETSGLGSLLEAVARTLDYPGLLARAFEDRREAVRDLLSRRAVLLLVDDVDRADLAMLAFLADVPGRTRALVSGRRRLPSEVRALMPEPLAAEAVRELLLAEAERQGAPAIGRELAELVSVSAPPVRPEPVEGPPSVRPEPVEGRPADGTLAAAARYPLLAGWAVAQLRRGQTIERVRERLARAEGEVFGEMFAASVAGLSGRARELLAVLPLLAGSTDRATLVAAGGSGAQGALDELLETSLLETSGPPTDEGRRYELHTVTRSFVSTHLPLAPGAERAALRRLIQHYAAIAEVFGGSAPNWRSFGRLERELPNVMTTVEAASAQARDRSGEPPGAQFDVAILQAAHGLRNVFSFGGAWSEGLVLFHRAIEAARRLGDARAEGWNLYRLGVLHYELGTGGYAEAAQRAREAVERLAADGDARGRGHALRLLGRATRARGRLADAEALLVEAETLLAVHGHGDDVAIVRASRADLLRLSGQLDQASALYQDVLNMGLRDPVTEANVRKDLGEIALARDDLDEARRCFAAAEALAEAAGARAIVAHCRLGLARVAHRNDRTARAADLARQAADLFERLGDLDRAYDALSVLR